MVSKIQDEWLEHDENIDLWLGNLEEKLDTKRRRILITHWVGEAYEKLMSDDYSQSLCHSFEKTGCLITADGSDDLMIRPEDLRGYVVPPPFSTVSSDRPLSCPIPEAAPDELQQDQIIDQVQIPLCMDEEQKEHEVADSPRVDDVKDRVYKHPLKNRKLKVLYQNWHVGTITFGTTRYWTSTE